MHKYGQLWEQEDMVKVKSKKNTGGIVMKGTMQKKESRRCA